MLNLKDIIVNEEAARLKAVGFEIPTKAERIEDKILELDAKVNKCPLADSDSFFALIEERAKLKAELYLILRVTDK